MMQCKERQQEGDLLCDEATHARSRDLAAFEELEPITVKAGGCMGGPTPYSCIVADHSKGGIRDSTLRIVHLP